MKKSARRTTAKKRPPIVEYASDGVAGNFYVEIGLARNQRTLIMECARQYGFKKQPGAAMSRMLLMLALANLPALEAWWRVHRAYAEAEGFWPDAYLENEAARVLKARAATTKR
jgi:hypothetical protein